MIEPGTRFGHCLRSANTYLSRITSEGKSMARTKKALEPIDELFLNTYLTFIEVVYIELRNHKTVKRWRCKCKCGKIAIIPPSKFVYGQVKSCGCKRSKL